jgi:hypothetical protein
MGLSLILSLLTWVAQRDLNDIKEKFLEQGRPTRIEAIIPSRDVSAKDNAASLYEAAEILAKARGLDLDLLPEIHDVIKSIHSNRIHKLEKALKPWKSPEGREVISLIREGSKRPHCDHDLDYSKGPGLMLPHLKRFRKWSGLLLTEALLEQNRPLEKRWMDVTFTLNMARHLEQEPMMVSLLVRYSCLEGIISALPLLPPDGFEDRILDIQSSIRESLSFSKLHEAIDMERFLMGEWVFNSILDGKAKEHLAGQIPFGLDSVFWRPFLIMDKGVYLRIKLDAHRHIHASLQQQVEQQKRDYDIPVYAVMTKLLAPDYRGLIVRHRTVLEKVQ